MDEEIFRFSRITGIHAVDTTIRVMGGTMIAMLGVVLGALLVVGGAMILGVIISVVWLLIFVPLSLNYIVATGSLAVGEEGLTWLVFGHTWRILAWSQICKIRIMRDYERGRKVRVLYVDIFPRPRLAFFSRSGGIFFRDTMSNFPRLRELINSYAARHNIPIILKDRHGERALDAIPP